MILISHRGNLEGRNPEQENNPLYIYNALNKGFEVEIDVWYMNNRWYLGHDSPEHEITLDYLKNNKFWCHAKNIDSLNRMLKEGGIHCFWHQEDDVTLTSNGFMWTYPGKPLTDKSICVLPEENNQIPKKGLGICSDCVVYYKEIQIGE
jgi:hypothetical protein